MMGFNATLVSEADSVLVRFARFADIHTYGENETEALSHAHDALSAYLGVCLEDAAFMCAPDAPEKGFVLVYPDIQVQLALAVRASGLRISELAKRSGKTWQNVQKIANAKGNPTLKTAKHIAQLCGVSLQLGN